MKVAKGLFLLGLGIVAGAAYFFDNRMGKERRRKVRKQLERVACVTNSVVTDCSSRVTTITSNLIKGGPSGWSPSPRFAGALGSVLTVYSVGRRGPGGTILRLLSLGLFARSLMAPNNRDSNMQDRAETRNLHPPSTTHEKPPVPAKKTIGSA